MAESIHDQDAGGSQEEELGRIHIFALEERFQAAVDGAGSVAHEQANVHTLLRDYIRAAVAVERHSVFSKNEEIDDVHTEDLMLLSIDFCIGKLHTLIVEPANRKRHLETASVYMDKFITKCLRMNIVHEGDEDAIMQEEEVDPHRQRGRKIERFRREKAARERMKVLQSALRQADDMESENRELFILRLQSFVRQALDEIQIIKQELQILEHREALEAEQGKIPDLESSRQITGPIPQADPNRPGISVTRLAKRADGTVRMNRETIKAQVFGSRIAPPTMTLAEFADEEMAKAKAIEEAQKNAEPPVRSYAQLEQDGDEENEELVELANMKDRAWDEWREANPKGIGNKMGKRF